MADNGLLVGRDFASRMGLDVGSRVAIYSAKSVEKMQTGAGKTMVVSGLGLLFGGRGDAGLVRVGSARAAIDGRLRVAPGRVAEMVDELGGDRLQGACEAGQPNRSPTRHGDDFGAHSHGQVEP